MLSIHTSLIKESNYNLFYFRKSKAYRIRALLRWFDPELGGYHTKAVGILS